MAKRTTQVRLDPETARALRDIASALGFTQRQGPTTGQGSVVKLFEAIAQGRLEVQRKEDVRRYMIAAHEAHALLQMSNPHPAYTQAVLDSLNEALSADTGAASGADDHSEQG
jgi:hypothetical protein